MPVLRNPKHEIYARERSFLTPVLQAARTAGYDRMTAGNAAKLDRNAKIRARVIELSKDDEDLVAMKRRFVERTLLRVATANAIDLWEPVLGSVSGKPVPGKFRAKNLTGLPAELQHAVKSVTIDDDKIKIEMHDKLAAVAQLQKLWGLPLEPDKDPGSLTINNVALLQLINRYEGMSEFEIARRLAFTLRAGTRQAEAAAAAPQGT